MPHDLIQFSDDHFHAEIAHGDERLACVDDLTPESEGRWEGKAGRRALAEAAWESGWDSALAQATKE